MYYQRLLASQDKAPVAAEIQKTEPKPEYEKAIKDPYIMEFLQIKPDTHVYESDIEQALIDHLQQFLLELGRGFSFVSRQKRFTLDGQAKCYGYVGIYPTVSLRHVFTKNQPTD